jgi:aspartate racemase
MLTIVIAVRNERESSAEYYRLINQGVRERLGKLHSAPCIMYSVDFAEIEAMQSEGRWDDAGQALAHAAHALETAGADFLVLCTNTMHKVADQVQAAIGIPLLDITAVIADALNAAGVARPGLLGNSYTMEESFYRERLTRHGLAILIPDAGDRATESSTTSCVTASSAATLDGPTDR